MPQGKIERIVANGQFYEVYYADGYIFGATEAAEFRPLGRDSLRPSGTALISTMPTPSGGPQVRR